MEFCPNCGRYMTRKTDKTVIFTCELCSEKKAGTAKDTLWHSEMQINENEKYRIFLERIGHDAAGKTVIADDDGKPIACDKCGLQYMTLVRIGNSARTRYVCECGNIYNP